MEVWRNGSLKHRLTLTEQQKGCTATFSALLLLPEVPVTVLSLSLTLSLGLLVCRASVFERDTLSFPSMCWLEGGAVECLRGHGRSVRLAH